MNVKSQTKTIPILNDLEHGDLFCNNDYNGYDLSYLVIRYLFETLENDEFKKLMFNFSEIKLIGNDIIQQMFDYFDEQLNEKHRKKV